MDETEFSFYFLTSLKNARKCDDNNRGILNADHIPPKDAISKAWKRLSEDRPEQQEQFKNTNPNLYEMIASIKDDNNGQSLIAMEVLAVDHRRALTTGRSHRATKCRYILDLPLKVIGPDESSDLVLTCRCFCVPLSSQRAAGRNHCQRRCGENAETVYDYGSSYDLRDAFG